MRQKINLNGEGEAGTVYWEDVKIGDGVYYIYGNKHLSFVFEDYDAECLYTRGETAAISFVQKNMYSCLKDLIDRKNEAEDYVKFYTLSGQRIVTEKELTVGDLNNGDNVGFVMSNGKKGYVVSYTIDCEDIFMPIGIENPNVRPNISWGDGIHHSLKDALLKQDSVYEITEAWLFKNRTGKDSLYAWLAED